MDSEDCDRVAKEQCYKFIPYDYTTHSNDIIHAEHIANILINLITSIDGCCTFWEDCGPLTAMLCHQLRLHGVGIKGALNAKQKSKTHMTLLQKTGDIPHFPRTYLYAGKCKPIEEKEDIEKLMHEFRTPCMLKLEFGSSAVGTKLVHNVGECVDEYVRLRNKLCSEADHPGIGLGHGNKMFLMERFSGSEHDVDIVIYERRLIAAYISDNGPTRAGSFTETTACMPSGLPSDKQGLLITAAYQCCVEVGLVSGVFNVEAMMTPSGPKLLEINARMGGFYLRDWIKRCYGVDLLTVQFLISCGIKPVLPSPEHRCHIMGAMCVPSLHGHLFKDRIIHNQLLSLENTFGEIRYNAIEEDFEDDIDADLEEPICNIALVGAEKEKTHDDFIHLYNILEINRENYDIVKLTESFYCN